MRSDILKTMLLKIRKLIDTQAIDIKKNGVNKYSNNVSRKRTIFLYGIVIKLLTASWEGSAEIFGGMLKLAEWIENNLTGSIEFKLLSKVFCVWGEISLFLKQAVVKEEDAPTFNQCIDEFEKNVFKLYDYGKHTFLKYDETPYCHMLRFYMPRLAREI